MQSVGKLKGIQDAIWFTTKNPKQSYAQSCQGKVADSDQICVNKWLIVGDDKLGIRLTNLGSLPDIRGAEPVERLWWGSFWLAGWWRLPLHFQSARRPGKHKEPSGDSTDFQFQRGTADGLGLSGKNMAYIYDKVWPVICVNMRRLWLKWL